MSHTQKMRGVNCCYFKPLPTRSRSGCQGNLRQQLYFTHIMGLYWSNDLLQTRLVSHHASNSQGYALRHCHTAARKD